MRSSSSPSRERRLWCRWVIRQWAVRSGRIVFQPPFFNQRRFLFQGIEDVVPKPFVPGRAVEALLAVVFAGNVLPDRERWNRAFSPCTVPSEGPGGRINTKLRLVSNEIVPHKEDERLKERGAAEIAFCSVTAINDRSMESRVVCPMPPPSPATHPRISSSSAPVGASSSGRCAGQFPATSATPDPFHRLPSGLC